MNNIQIIKDTDIGLYTILINGEVKYECLSPDEVSEIFCEIMTDERKGGEE